MSHDNIPEKCGKYMKYLPIYDDKFEENYDEMKQQSFFLLLLTDDNLTEVFSSSQNLLLL